jgi:hypothetical protein
VAAVDILRAERRSEFSRPISRPEERQMLKTVVFAIAIAVAAFA